MPAKSLMVMGAASDVGKSVVATGLCRAFARAGIQVAPFKSQNMSNNAAVCPAGGEIGRAQAAQAEACRLEPSVEMNPVLLKPESESGCQVVIRGRARFRIQVADYERYRAAAWPEIVASYEALARRYELIIIEGAGGAAEINLRHRDIVNWPIAELANAPVLIVGDIDKGGVFASLFGTVELLTPAERARVHGFLINKFRGVPTLLESGLQMLRELTGIPTLGLLPYLEELHIPSEDSASLELARRPADTRPVNIGVLRLPRISNYTDFAALEREADVTVRYMSDPAAAPRVDVLILPGTKNTCADLSWLRQVGWEDYLARHIRDGGKVVGICGGYQMLGRRILDPHNVESDRSESVGLGLLDIETAFDRDKVTALVKGFEIGSGLEVSGYEIHSGRLIRDGAARPIFQLTERGQDAIEEPEGCASEDGKVWGSSIHGLFDSTPFRSRFIDAIRAQKGLAPQRSATSDDAAAVRALAYDRFADILTAHADLDQIASLVGLRIRLT